MIKKLALTALTFLVWAVPGTSCASQPVPDQVLHAKSNSLVPDWINLLQQKAAQSKSEADQVELALAYLQLARQPGWSRYYDKAQHLLNATQQPTSVTYWLARADSAQQQHQFQHALNYLTTVQRLEPTNINAILMINRIYLVQNNTAAALKQCKKLQGQQELFLLSLCSLEATGRQGKTKDSYKALQLLARQQHHLPLPQRYWLLAVLAEQAEALQQKQQARSWLEQVINTEQAPQAPLPLWVKWADLTLQSDSALVYRKLQHLHQQFPLEDALLLRLALAEQQTASGVRYQQLMQQRVQLREQRADTLHSADLAHYYLRLAPDYIKALHYAQLNFQQAQEPDDQQLLTTALQQAQQASASLFYTGEHL